MDFWGTIMEQGVRPSPLKQIKEIIAPKMRYGDFVILFEQSFMTQHIKDLYEGLEIVQKNFGIKLKKKDIEKIVGIWNKNKILAKPFPDTIETLTYLRKNNIKIGLVANTDPLSVPSIVEKYKLEFDSHCYSYEEHALKISGKLFHKVIKDFGLKKDEVIVIADSIQSDIKPAIKEGLKAYLIDRKDRREFDNKIKTLLEIKNIK